MKMNYFSKKLIILLSILSSNLIASIVGGEAGIETKHYFLPEDTKRIKAVLDKALVVDGIGKVPKKVKLASYWLTDISFIDKLINLKSRGTDVQVIYDSSQPNGDTIMDKLLHGNIVPVLTPTKDSDNFMPRSDRLMHNKSMVVDDMVFTGSANYTVPGFGVNDETVTVYNSPVTARQFEANFDKIQNRTFDAYISHKLNDRRPSDYFRDLFKKLYKKNEIFKRKCDLKGVGKIVSGKLPTEYMLEELRKYGVRTTNMSYDEAYEIIGKIKYNK